MSYRLFRKFVTESKEIIVCSQASQVCSIVPPHMLRQIMERGNPGQRDRAFKVICISEQIRGERKALGSISTALGVPTGEKRCSVYDARNEEVLPGILVRETGESPVEDPAVEDPAVNEAYDGAGATYDLYFEAFGRNSIDDRGLRLDSTVHYGEDYENAFWNGLQMVYGDGDGQIFNRFTRSVDVIGHELTHGVIQYEADLVYRNEPGALNESFADVFGSLVKQRLLKQMAEEASWLIGEELFTDQVQGVALRSMKEPGSAYDDPVLGEDPQPSHMDDYKQVDYDNGGVHINSGIPNRAFYLAAAEIGGYSWGKAGLIWYTALRDYLRYRADFQGAAQITANVARELFGPDSPEENAVRKGWSGVGIEAEIE